MRKRIISRVTAVISLLLCLLTVFNSVAVAAESGSDALSADDIEISRQCGVLEGKSVQLTAMLTPENALMSSVEWSSSDPKVISCTSDGIITGVSAGGYADITCKAKWGKASDKIRVYCVEPADEYIKSDFVGLITPIYAQPSWGQTVTMHFNTTFFIRYMMDILAIYFKYINYASLGIKSSADLAGGKCEIRGRYNSYAYIIVETESGYCDGFVKYTKLEAQTNLFLSLSAEDIDVWGNGYVNTNKKLTTTYKGDVKWTVSDDTVVDFNHETGQIKGLKPGTATITAKADGMEKKCTVHSLYRWPQTWTTATNCSTHLYKAEGSEYVEAMTLTKGRSFTVYGDNGTSDGWAYGVTTIGGNEYWGYIPISHVSTKGTISQYSNMTTTLRGKKVLVVWPMYDTSIKNISSPYAPRNITDSGSIHHRGYDITTGTPGEIAGEYVVASFSGTVTKIYKNTTDCGFSISISTDAIDPVTGKNIAIIYMHLLEIPKYSNGVNVSLGDYVPVGTIIGKVGKSNGNTDPDMGYHLHFEANSQNASVGDLGRSDFTYTLNPMYFFIDKEVTFSGTKSYNKYGGYWYDLNGGYINEEIFMSYFNF